MKIKPAAPVETDDVIIRAEQVVKTYDTGPTKIQALRGADLEIRRGEMVAVMGPSGCGMTTLLNALPGIDDVDSGEIWLEGRNLPEMGDKERTNFRAQRMGFVFHVHNLPPLLNGVENVELPLPASGVPAKQARERAMHALEQFQLAQWAKHRPAELSGGQRQRFTIDRALVNRPALVWADGPTGALDSTTDDEIMGLMTDLNTRERQTLVIVTHDHGVGAQCGRVIRMNDGQIVGKSLEEPAS